MCVSSARTHHRSPCNKWSMLWCYATSTGCLPQSQNKAVMTVGGQKDDETCLPSVIIYDGLSALDVIANARPSDDPTAIKSRTLISDNCAAVMLTRTWAPRPRPRPRTRNIKVKFFTGLHCAPYIIFSWLMLCVFLSSHTISRVITTFCQFMNKWMCYCC